MQLVPFSTCHYWTGAFNSHGYGVYNRSLAHRLAFERTKGPIPASIRGRPAVVRHDCDNPACVNPDHLRLGTQADNIADMKKRGRASQGEGHVHAKLREGDAERIVAAVASGEPVSKVAKEYGISPSRVSTIRYGHSNWCSPKRPTGRSDRRISDETARAVYAAACAEEPRASIAARFGIPATMVSDIKRGATYASVTGHRR